MIDHSDNYYFIRRLARDLKPFLIGNSFSHILSLHKGELVFYLNHPGKFNALTFVRLPEKGLLFPSNKTIPNKNFLSHFNEVVDKEILDVILVENDRSFYLKIKGYHLLFKLYGIHGNIILFEKNTPRSLLYPNYSADRERLLTEYVGFPPGDYLELKQKLVEGNSVWEAIKTTDPQFPEGFEGIFSLECPSETSWETYLEHKEYLLKAPVFVNRSSADEKKNPGLAISFIKNNPVFHSTDTLDVLNFFAREFLKEYFLLKKKNELDKRWTNELKKTDKSLLNARKRYKVLTEELNYGNLGDLIMANLHSLKKGMEYAELIDFYSGKPVEIKLNPSLSPQLNAEKYYKKAKNQDKEVDILHSRIRGLEARRSRLIEDLDHLHSGAGRDWINGFFKKKEIRENKPTPEFKSLDLGGITIYIGRNAKNNDKLTFSFASKNDIWLHAKDVKGSHVIIKLNEGKEVSPEMLEKAASVAAWNSGGKGHEYCPVSYTLKKYVRKPKGFPPGKVIIDKEKVLIVKPWKGY